MELYAVRTERILKIINKELWKYQTNITTDKLIKLVDFAGGDLCKSNLKPYWISAWLLTLNCENFKELVNEFGVTTITIK
jgi:hypothetical protein